MATAAIQPLETSLGPASLPGVTWRDPHTLSREELANTIVRLENACQSAPHSADLRTCLGMAYAMNFQVYESFDALERAIELDPNHFWARLKHAELLYRLRVLVRAEEEMLGALHLAESPQQAAIARKHLADIRRLRREGTQKPEWKASLRMPALALLFLILCSAWMVGR
jgi:tetratricopeptide (TPR) repeat protein